MRGLLDKYLLCNVAREGEGGGGAPPVAPPAGGDVFTPVAAPWATATEGPWKLGEAGKEREWWDTIPEDKVREHVKAKGYKTPAELAMGNYNLTKMQTGATDVVGIPGPNATQNDWDAFYQKLGRPNAPTDYDLKFGEGVQVDEKMVGFGKDLFHKMGLSNDRANQAATAWNEFVAKQNADMLEAANVENSKAMAALELSWGADLEANRAAGERVVKSIGLPEDMMNAVEGAIGVAPLVHMLAMIGRKSDEGTLLGGGAGGDPNDPANMTKDQAQSKINELNSDNGFQAKYTDKNHPEHKQAVDFMQKLFMKT